MGDERSTEKEEGRGVGVGGGWTEAEINLHLKFFPAEEEGQGGRWGRDLQV